MNFLNILSLELFSSLFTQHLKENYKIIIIEMEEYPPATDKPLELELIEDDNLKAVSEDLHTRYDGMISNLERLTTDALDVRFDGIISKLEQLKSDADSLKQSFGVNESCTGSSQVNKIPIVRSCSIINKQVQKLDIDASLKYHN